MSGSRVMRFRAVSINLKEEGLIGETFKRTIEKSKAIVVDKEMTKLTTTRR